MTRPLRSYLGMTAMALALLAGVVIGLQPVNWIEERLGVDPDGGSGFLEFLWALVPVAAGLAFAMRAVQASSREPATLGSGGENGTPQR